MKVITISPMPIDVPKLAIETNSRSVRQERKLLSLASDIMAGLSLKNVITAARAAIPGRLYMGRMSGRNKNSIRRITPNSMKSLASAPVSTVIAIMKKTVCVRSSKAVCIIELRRFFVPMVIPKKPIRTTKPIRKSTASTRRSRRKEGLLSTSLGRASGRKLRNFIFIAVVNISRFTE